VTSTEAHRRPLSGANVALVYGPGSLAVEWAAGLPRGIERALLELGANVHTFTTAHFKNHIQAFYRTRPDPTTDRFPSDSPFIRDLLAFLRGGPSDGFDVVLGYLYDTVLLDEVVDVLQSRGRRLINYPLNLLDQPHHFGRALRVFGETWCAEEGALSNLRAQIGDRVHYVPMASDPFIFRPVGVAEEPALLFVGSAYGHRIEWLGRLSSRLPMTVSGMGFDPRGVAQSVARTLVRERRVLGPATVWRMTQMGLRAIRRPISDEEFVRLSATHGLSIGFSDVRQESTNLILHKTRLRDYDAPMTGLCHMARRLPELEQHFAPGEEMLLYGSFEELEDLCDRIRGGQIDWRAIGRRARARSIQDHTWTKRLEPLFS